MRFRFLSILCILLLTACSKQEDTSAGDDHPIGFTPDVESKAVPVTGATLATMGIWAYYTGERSWNEAKGEANPGWMDNRKYLKADQRWTANPVAYWPYSPADRLSFFAYSPYATSTNGITVDSSQPGEPRIGYQTPVAIGNQVDLVVASALDKTKTTGSVALKFSHILVRVNVSAKLGNLLSPAVRITRIRFSNVKSAAVYSFATGEWEAADTPLTFEAVLTPVDISLTEPATLLGENRYFMFLPQTLENVTLEIAYIPAPFTGETLTKRTTLSGTWEKGRPLNYEITF